jgi:hypothetical protein
MAPSADSGARMAGAIAVTTPLKQTGRTITYCGRKLVLTI